MIVIILSLRVIMRQIYTKAHRYISGVQTMTYVNLWNSSKVKKIVNKNKNYSHSWITWKCTLMSLYRTAGSISISFLVIHSCSLSMIQRMEILCNILLSICCTKSYVTSYRVSIINIIKRQCLSCFVIHKLKKYLSDFKNSFT